LTGSAGDPHSVSRPAQRRLARKSFSALHTRNFRLFFIGQLISNSGNWLTTVALTLLVLHRTGSGVYVGLIAACQYGPVLLLTAWGGLVADRSNKRNLLFVTQSLEMIESFVLAFLAFLPHAPLPAFFITAAAGGSFLAFDNPGRRSFVNEMVAERDLPNAVTLYSAMSALSRILGPTFAGALIVTLGYGWCFTVDGVSYLLVLAALAMMRPSELRRTPVANRGRGQIRSGIRYLISVPELRISFSMLLIIGTATYNFTVTFPLLVEKGLHGSDSQYTFVYAFFSLGGVIATFFLARRSRIGLRSIVNAAAMVGIAMLALFFVPNVLAACAAATLLGGVGVAYMSSTTAIVQLQPDRAMIGRVIALQTILQIGTTPIGGPILGFIADTAGPRAPVLVGSVAALGAATLGLVSGRRHLADYKSFSREPKRAEQSGDVASEAGPPRTDKASAPLRRPQGPLRHPRPDGPDPQLEPPPPG
jgi:MFS family permease